MGLEAESRFLADCVRKPAFDDRRRDLDYLPLETHRVTIENLRAHSATLDLDGFVILDRSSRVRDVRHPAERMRYLREIEELIRDLTGAAKAVALGNGVIRRS